MKLIKDTFIIPWIIDNKEINIIITASLCVADVGIGSYEFHGAKGFDNHLEVDVVDYDVDDIEVPKKYQHLKEELWDNDDICDRVYEIANDRLVAGEYDYAIYEGC